MKLPGSIVRAARHVQTQAHRKRPHDNHLPSRRRTQAAVGDTAVLGLLGAGPALSARPSGGAASTAAKGQSAAATTAVPGNVAFLQSRTSLLGVHRWYRQMQSGYPVVGGLYARHIDTTGATKGQVTVWDGRVAVGPLTTTRARVSATSASAAAATYTDGTPLTYVKPSLSVLPGAESHLVWSVTTQTTTGGTAQAACPTSTPRQAQW